LNSATNGALNTSRVGIPQGNYTGTGLWFVPTSTPISFIRFALSAPQSYTPEYGFGHHYYVQFNQVTEKNSGFFGIGASSKTWIQQTREPNPMEGLITSVPNPSVDAKGVLTTIGAIAGSFIPGIGTIVGGLIGSLVGDIVDGLFHVTKTTKLLSNEDHYDELTGLRSAIGVTDIDISQRQYAQTSTLESTQLTFSKPLQAVSLITTEQIPDDWPTDQDWIQYFVSTDQQTWQKIVPMQRTTGTNDVVKLNGEMSLYVRILLNRPANLPGETAAVLSYALQGLPVS
jgi:hypothetical protein